MSRVAYYVIGIMVLLSLGSVYGQSINLVLDTYTLESCAYTTKMISGYVENTGSNEEEIKVYSNSKWVTIAQDSFVLAPGERKYISIFVTPTDEAKTGRYYAKIYATSTNGEDVETLNIDIMDCSDITLDVKDTTLNSCIGDVIKVPFYIENNARTTEFITLEVDKGNLEFYETQLDAYERDKNYLYYKVMSDYAVITLKATSKNSFARDVKKIYVNGERCYDFDFTVVPQSADVCMKDQGLFDLYIKNTGEKENTINLRASEGVLSETSVTLQPGERKVVTLKVKPSKEGEIAVEVEAWDKVKRELRDLQITAKMCSNNAMLVVPKEMDVCKGSSARYVIGIRNLGEKEERMELVSNLGEFDNAVVEIKPQEIVYRELYINTLEMDYQNYSVEINLTKEGKTIDTLTMRLGVKNCYNGEIYTPYKEVKACKYTPSKPVDVFIKNTGEKRERYYVSARYGVVTPDVIELEPMEEGVVKYVVNISDDVAEGIVEERLVLKGLNMKEEKVATLNIDLLKESMCSNFSVGVEPLRIDAEEYRGYIYRVKIRNNGYAPNTFKVVLEESYGMVYVEPETIYLRENEEGVVFLYVAPTSKMPNKVYEIKGKVVDKFNNYKVFNVEFNLMAYKEEFVEGSDEDKIIVRARNIDTEKIYYVSKDNITTVSIEYVMEGKKEVEEILFIGGSFIVQIGDELYEDTHPEIGKRTYVIRANNKTYKITVKFVHVDNENSEYKFMIEDVVIEKERKQLFKLKEEGEGFSINWKFLIPIVVILIGVGIILYDFAVKSRKSNSKVKKKSRKKEIKELKEAIEE